MIKYSTMAMCLCLVVWCTSSRAWAEVLFFGAGESAAFDAAAAGFTLQTFNGIFTTDATNSDPLDFGDFTVTETTDTPNLHKAFNFLHVQSDDPSTVTFVFDEPINAFGVTTIDFAREAGLPDGVDETITYVDNSPGGGVNQIVVEITTDPGIGVGNAVFFGVVNTTESFTQVSLTSSTGVTSIGPFNGDDIGYENLKYHTVIPEPRALTLVIAGAAAVWWFTARKRRHHP